MSFKIERLPFCVHLLVFAQLLVISVGLAQDALSSELRNTASLVGTVSSAKGDIPHARVTAYRITALHGHAVLERACSATTNDSGRYECRHLSPGRYMVALEASLEHPVSTENLPRFMFSPTGQDLDTASVLQIRQDQEETANIYLQETRDSFSVLGTIPRTASDGTLSLFQVSTSGLEYRLPIIPKKSDDGKFEFTHVPSGRYTLKGRWFEGTEEMFALQDVSVLQDNVRGLKPAVSRAIELLVHLDNSESLRFPIRSMGVEDVKTGSHTVASTENGSQDFLLKELKPGNYNLFALDPSDVCVDSVSLGGRAVELPLRITGEQKHMSIDVHVNGNCGSVAGVLSNGGAGTVLITTDDFDAIKAARADKQGRFRIEGLNEGSYRLFAFASLEEVPFRDLSYLRMIKDKSTAITISGGNELNQISLNALQ